jgi:hypothetical protein
MRRAAVGLLLVIGIAMVAAPFLVSVPDDAPFLSIFQQKKAPGPWTSRGSISMGGKTYTLQIEQTFLNGKGDSSDTMTVLEAKGPSGETKTYRRTRYFSNDGYEVETIEQTPTRTVKRGRGPQEKDPFQEVVLSDTSPLLARKAVRIGCFAGGGFIGLVLVVLPRRRKRAAVNGA